MPAGLRAAARRLAREMAAAGWAGAPSDVEIAFELDEHGRVWMIREGDCHVIGRREAVCAEMVRFVREVGDRG